MAWSYFSVKKGNSRARDDKYSQPFTSSPTLLSCMHSLTVTALSYVGQFNENNIKPHLYCHLPVFLKYATHLLSILVHQAAARWR